jgi:hypothetical protein
MKHLQNLVLHLEAHNVLGTVTRSLSLGALKLLRLALQSSSVLPGAGCAEALAADMLRRRASSHFGWVHQPELAAMLRCCVGDFGAASFYPPQTSGGANPFEALEVRAFGCLLGELLERSEPTLDVRLPSLKALQLRCVAPVAASRPRFAELVATLEALRP